MDHDRDTALAFATVLVDADARDDAATVLAELLTPLDPAATDPDGRLAAAATLYGQVVEPVPGRVPDAVAWARYAHRAAAILHGPAHPCTVVAAQVLVLLLDHPDRPADADVDAEAAALCRRLIRIHREAGDIDAYLGARMDHAEQLHRIGRCGQAIGQATRVWRQWTTRHDVTDTQSVFLVTRLGHMLLACGRIGEAIAAVADAIPDVSELDDRARGTYHTFLTMFGSSHQRPHRRQWHPADPPQLHDQATTPVRVGRPAVERNTHAEK